MKLKYPKTIAAVKSSLKNQSTDQWAIGDALVAECGPSGKDHTRTGVEERLHEATDEIHAECDVDDKQYSFPTNRNFWRISSAFPSDAVRTASVSWSCHYYAGDPATLTAIVASAKQQGKPVTVAFVKAEKRKHEEQERKGRYKKAVKDQEQAKSDLNTAKKQQREATDEDEQEQATKDRLKAEAQLNAAEKRMQRNKPTGKAKDGLPQPSKEPGFLVRLHANKLLAEAAAALSLLKETLVEHPNECEPLGEQLHEQLLELIEQAHDIDTLVKPRRAGAHLKVVEK